MTDFLLTNSDPAARESRTQTNLLARLWSNFRAWRLHRRTRRLVSHLDVHLRKDIGLPVEDEFNRETKRVDQMFRYL